MMAGVIICVALGSVFHIALQARGQSGAPSLIQMLLVNVALESADAPFPEGVPVSEYARKNHRSLAGYDPLYHFIKNTLGGFPLSAVLNVHPLSRANNGDRFNVLGEPDLMLARLPLAWPSTRPLPHVVGRCLSGVPKDGFELRPIPFQKSHDFDVPEREICSQLPLIAVARDTVGLQHRLGSITSILYGLPGEDDLIIKKDGSYGRHDDRREGGDHHPESPYGHRLLGREIALFVILASGGGWVCYYAFNRAGNGRKIAQTLGWALVVILAALVTSYSAILLMIGAV